MRIAFSPLSSRSDLRSPLMVMMPSATKSAAVSETSTPGDAKT
jgi:hypothetical protein